MVQAMAHKATVWIAPDMFPKAWGAEVEGTNICCNSGCYFTVRDAVLYKMKQQGMTGDVEFHIHRKGEPVEVKRATI